MPAAINERPIPQVIQIPQELNAETDSDRPSCHISGAYSWLSPFDLSLLLSTCQSCPTVTMDIGEKLRCLDCEFLRPTTTQ